MSPRPAADHAARIRRLMNMSAWLAEVRSSTVEELATRFDMTPVAVRKDLLLLSMTAVGPDASDFLSLSVDESGEVVHFERELFTRPLRLTAHDAFAVIVAGQAMLEVASDPSDSGVAPLASALQKLRTAMGERGTVAVDVAGPPQLGALRRAAAERRTVRIRYHAAYRDEVTERDLDPFVVYHLEGAWFVRGRDHASGDDGRIFRVDRILSLETTDQRFERPSAPTSAVTFVRSSDTVDVTLRVPASGRWVLEAYDVQSYRELGEGALEVVLAVTGEVWLAALLVRLGRDARVLDPAALAGAGCELAGRLLALYEQDPSPAAEP